MDLSQWVSTSQDSQKPVIKMSEKKIENKNDAIEEVLIDDMSQEQSTTTQIAQTKPQMPSNDSLPGECRVQSPSSILTHKQCPRKYYYRYIEKLPGPKSIHLIRGSVVHKVLEDVYDVDLSKVPASSFFHSLKYLLQEMFRKEWFKSANQLAELGLSPEKLDEYFSESQLMVDNFYHYMFDKMQPLLDTMTPHDAWKKLMPERELFMESAQHLVKGYIDVVQKEIDGTVAILDYKTSKKLEITDEYRLQLGIYAMMHEENNKPAHEVGVIFLKHGQEIRLPITPELVDNARNACMEVQLHTRSSNQRDYPMRPTPLCKWKTGQCEYYELCFEGRSVNEYREIMNLKR